MSTTETLTNNPDTASSDEINDTEFSYEILANPYERMHYVHLTDDLIERMDGSSKEPKPDFVIYLDKSARPVNWMVQSLWDTLAAKDEEGNIAKRPQSLFVNIDARRPKDNSANGIANLRALFTVEEPRPGLETMNQETLLDGKEVLIVDEVSVSGDTLNNARELLQRAYPSAKLKTFSWMNGMPKVEGGPESNSPRWYERGNDRNRVVIEDDNLIASDPERAKELFEASDERARRGWSWLAKLPRAASPSSRRLHQEIRQITEDIKTGQLPYWPSDNRADEEARIKQFNGVNLTDFYSFRRWMQTRFWPGVAYAGSVTDTTGPLSPEIALKEARAEALRLYPNKKSLSDVDKEFRSYRITEGAAEFKKRFTFTQESVAASSLAAAARRSKN